MFFHNIGISRLIALMALFPATLVYAWGGESANLTPPSSVQQTHDCSGIVLDASGAPIAGVAVSVKGTTNGVSTDLDG